MKQLINQPRSFYPKFIGNETHETADDPIVPVVETPVINTSTVEAATAAAGAKDITLTPSDLPPAPAIQADAHEIEAGVSHVASVVAAPDALAPTGEALDLYATIPEDQREAADEAITARLTEARAANPDLSEDDIAEIRAEASAEFLATNLRSETLETFDRDITAAREAGNEDLVAQLEAQRAAFEARDVQTELTDAIDFLEGSDPAAIVESLRASGEAYGPSGSSFGNGVSGTMEGVPEISNSEMLAHCDTVAQQLGVDTAAVKAVVAVESAGQMNATRFEPHIHARYPDTPEPTRTQLATSYGAFQIMGFNHEVSGFSSPQEMIDAMATPQGQLQAFAGFIQSNPRIHGALRDHDWPTFAHGYNGPAYRQNNYDQKMAAAYNRYSRDSGIPQ